MKSTILTYSEMKKFTLKSLMAIGIIAALIPSLRAQEDTITMGSGYANDVYYNLETGVELTVARALWDLAFSTKVFSASILINDGTAGELYTWGGGDTSGWANVDTVGMSAWGPLYNDPDDWEMGAFTRNENGHPDYGWGVYNSFTHEVMGDSIYLLKRDDGSVYKLWIKKKTYNAGKPVWIFRSALIDGTNDHTDTVDCTPYMDKNFIYYSLGTAAVIDREPASADWDLLFTKYMAMHPTGAPVVVTGALSNYDLGIAEVNGVSQLLYNDFKSHPYDSSRSVVGYDWKYFDLGTFSYTVDDSTVFFIKTGPEDIWKIYFESFAGTMTGKMTLRKFKMSTAGLDDFLAREQGIYAYPNPASQYTTVVTNLAVGEAAVLRLLDLQGRVIAEQNVAGSPEAEETRISLEGLKEGIYLVSLEQGHRRVTTRIVVR